MAPHDDTTETGTVTRLLGDMSRGDDAALPAVVSLVYRELRVLAHRHRARWQGDDTLGTTALVNEAYLKLVGANAISVQSRAHFLRVAAMAMRQVLCNYARDQRAAKRGSGAADVAIEMLDGDPHLLSPEAADTAGLSELDDALVKLERSHPRLVRVVECRFFSGLSIEETAAAVGASPATVKRDWALARAWLFRELQKP